MKTKDFTKKLNQVLTLVLTIAALAAGHTTAWATVTGSGTEGDPFVVDSWADLKEKMAAGGYIRLGTNVSDPDKSSSSYLSVPSGVTVTLDLAGHTIDRALTETTNSGYVINLAGTLTINDSSSPSTGTITGGWNKSGYSGCVNTNNGSSLTLNGGTISGNKVDKTSGEAKGGAVYVTVNATFTMNGGAITGNSVSTSGGAWGGGVCVHGWSSGVGTFNMNGGTISGNSVTGSDNSKGGGVYYYSGGHFNLKGNCTITGNTCNDVANNVKAESSINITGALDATTRIGLTAAVNTQLTSNNIATYGSVANFTSDLPIYAPEVYNGYVRLVAVGVFVAAREATCTETGISQNCWLKDGHYYSDQACTVEINPVTPALGHDMTHHDAVAATATTFGNVEYWTCSRCGKYFLDANGDTETTAEAVRTLPTSVITVAYVDAGGTEHNADAIPLAESMTTLTEGTYVVNSSINFTSTVTLAGDVTLILADGYTMSIGTENSPLDADGIDSPYNLTIYGQSLGTGYLKIYCAAYNGIQMGGDKAYTQHSGNVVIVNHSGPCIYQGTITLDGGTLDVQSEGNDNGDIAYASSISILGGQLHARGLGLHAADGITLGCTNASDVIYAASYSGSVTVADGKALFYWSNDEKHTLTGTLTAAQISAIAGKELTKAMTWADLSTLMAAGGTRTVTLTNDVTRPAAGGIDVAGTVTLDLNGYTIDGNRELNPIFFVSDGVSLTITDSQTGGNVCQAGSNPTINVDTGGSLTLAAGTINVQAMGVNVRGSFTMTGGAITGGSIRCVWLGDGSSFTMSGGSITGNDQYGVQIGENASFTMTGGTITGNNDGGVLMDDKTATFIVSGNVNITGNTTSDVLLYPYYNDLDENVLTPVTIGGALASTARIGINIYDYFAENYITGDAVKTITSGLSGNGTRQNFVLNGRDGHALVIPASGEMGIATAYTLTVPENVTVSGLTAETDGTYKVGCSDIVTLSHNRTGYSATYSVNSTPIDGSTLTMPEKDVTVTATWKKLLTNTDITIADIPSQEYTGSALTPVVGITDGTKALNENTDYTVTLPEGGCTNTGDYTITLTGIGSYDGTTTKTFTINPKVTDYGALDVSQNENGTTATIDGTATGTINITNDVVVDNVSLGRTFTANEAATLMLPFAIDVANTSGAKFYTYTGVTFDTETNKWKATMTQVESGTIAANTPYVVMPTSTSIDFNNSDPITLNTTGGGGQQTTNGEWTFKGTYETKTWTAGDVGNDYGFAATSGKATDGVTDVNAGDFVKLAAGAHIKPGRSYLTYTGGGNPFAAPKHRAGTELPCSISVVLVNSDGTTTEIETTNFTNYTNYTNSDVWFTLDGRKLDKQPTTKGLYIVNGKKTVIK